MDLSLKKSERLSKQKDFENLYSIGNKITGNFIVFLFAKAKENKVGFIVSKKISKKATVRNKLKRWLRESYRRNKWIVTSNYHFLLIAKENILNTSFQELNNEICDLLQKINDYYDKTI